MSIDEVLGLIEEALVKTTEAQEYEIGDRRVRRPRLRELIDYYDRMLARKAREDAGYKSGVFVRFNFDR